MQKIKNKNTPIFLSNLLILLGFVFFSTVGIRFYMDFSVYSNKKIFHISEIKEWKIIKNKEDDFLISMDFKFCDGIDGPQIVKYTFIDNPYPDKSYANLMLNELKNKQLNCYFLDDDGRTLITLTNDFPVKLFLYSIVSFIIFIYFIYFKYRYFKIDY